MSYLDLPRIHFSGRFFADPCTVNNDPGHYDPANTRPSPWQTPQGENTFALVDCRVVTVTDQTGKDSSTDPLLGAAFQSVVPHALQGPATWNDGFSARLVDLDVYQQAVSQIFGMKIRIVLRGTGGGQLVGTLDTPALNSVHFNCVLPKRGWRPFDGYGSGSYGGDSNASGVFQTRMVVAPGDWPSGSPVLDQLRAATGKDDQGNIIVSFRMVPDGYVNVPDTGNPNYLFGRVVGTLGPLALDELPAATGPRWLNPTYTPSGDPANPTPWYIPAFYGAPFTVDTKRKVLVLDLANAIARRTVGGPRVDLGNVEAHVGPAGSRTLLGKVDVSQFAYDQRAGIAELPLTADQLALCAENPVVLTADGMDFPANPVLAESEHGVFVACDQRVVRLTPPMDATAPGDPDLPKGFPNQVQVVLGVRVTRFGQPAPDIQLDAKVITCFGNTAGITVPPWVYPGDSPGAAGAVGAKVGPTAPNGQALVTVEVGRDPGQRTTQLDGQLYFVYPYDPATVDPAAPPWGIDSPKPGSNDPAGVGPVQEQQISVIAWGHYAANENPAWSEIQGLMEPYTKLYPAMKELIDLTDEHSFGVFAAAPPWWSSYTPPGTTPPPPVMGLSCGAITYYLSRAFDDPLYMPVTRDFSPNKLKTVLYYIKNTLGVRCPPPPSPGGEGGGGGGGSSPGGGGGAAQGGGR